ncbi:MAG: queuosine precursor transporter [Clostridia bacterium]|nr:queuosine precursor transporter [Clostridia bacterium]
MTLIKGKSLNFIYFIIFIRKGRLFVLFKSSNKQVSLLFLFITCFFVTCLLISNIIAGKLIEVFGITLPAAVIIFPITYLFGDIITEVYGFKRARLVIWIGFLANFFMITIFFLTISLPYPDFWESQQAFVSVLGFTPRVVIASLIAYFVGEFSNSIVLSKMKILTKGRWLWTRTIGSTLVGEGIDTVLFIAIAFGDMLPFSVVSSMILAQYIWKVGYEILATPFTYMMVNWVKCKEGIDRYDIGVSYNPFGLEVKDETV